MADFFTRLAERTLGHTPVARPNVAALSGLTSQRPASDEAAMLEETTASMDAREQRAASSAVPARISEWKAGRENPRRGPDSLRPQARASFTQASVVPGVTLPNRAMSDGEHDEGAAKQQRAERMAPGEFLERMRPSSPAPEFRPDAPVRSVAPTIHVTIGRIDVRAITPSSPSLAPRARARAPLKSLDEYLTQRNGKRL
jgi:hypothetical protein